VEGVGRVQGLVVGGQRDAFALAGVLVLAAALASVAGCKPSRREAASTRSFSNLLTWKSSKLSCCFFRLL